ncbi:(2Fe-2S)-binding protein [Microbaculum marinum]|uniref:2Fe-2S iron-sulfur cluster-binding protein n=1 Tax=Microbaculum marinum TaxID=1764581 RepID=A0AAW9RTM2_9HYPH
MEQTLEINGNRHRLDIEAGETLIEVLRDRLKLTAAKVGCGRGECGACTVLIGGRAKLACVTLAACVDDPVETAEGLADEARGFREAMADRGGFQCSYCTPGMVVRAVSILRGGDLSDDDALRRDMAGNLCRCTGYQGIIESLRLASQTKGSPA